MCLLCINCGASSCHYLDDKRSERGLERLSHISQGLVNGSLDLYFGLSDSKAYTLPVTLGLRGVFCVFFFFKVFIGV